MMLLDVRMCRAFHATRDNAISDVERRRGRSPPCRSRIPLTRQRTMPVCGMGPETDWETLRSLYARLHPRQDSNCN